MNCFKKVLAGAVAGLLAAVAAALILAVPTASAGASLVGLSSWIVLGAAALAGGLFTGRSVGRNGLLWGAACGAVLFAVLMLIGLGLCREVGWTALIKAALCAGVGGLGGAVGVNLSGRRAKSGAVRLLRRRK